MNDRQLRQTLELALKDRAPGEYAQMRRNHRLATYLNDLTSQAMQSISAAMDVVTEQAAMRQPPFNNEATVVQQVNMARKAAEETALSQAIEAMPLEATEDEPEPTEPMSLEEMTGDYWREKMAAR